MGRQLTQWIVEVDGVSATRAELSNISCLAVRLNVFKYCSLSVQYLVIVCSLLVILLGYIW